jgi:hypothetical protein
MSQEAHFYDLLEVGRLDRPSFALRRHRWKAHYFYGKGTEKDVSELDLALQPNGSIEVSHRFK